MANVLIRDTQRRKSQGKEEKALGRKRRKGLEVNCHAPRNAGSHQELKKSQKNSPQLRRSVALLIP